jgi:hypothetical protein
MGKLSRKVCKSIKKISIVTTTESIQHTVTMSNADRAKLILKIYLQMNELCGLHVPNGGKQLFAKQRIVADALLSILNDTGEVVVHLDKMQSDFYDKGIACRVPDLLSPVFMLQSVRYSSSIKGLYTEISYRLSYTLDGDQHASTIVASAPTQLYDSMVASSSTNTVARLACYYTMLGMQTGQFWGLLPSFYSEIRNQYSSALECFASPFNHSMDSFCSPFSSIEHPFGSVGDFFQVFPADTQYRAYVVNPPFVLPVMQRVFDYIVSKLASCPKVETATSDCKSGIVVILYLPNWQDVIVPFLERLRGVSDVIFETLQRGKSMVHDYAQQRSLTAQFESVVIMASTTLTDSDREFFNTKLVRTLRN